MTQQTAVVLGATGMVGNLLTQRLLKDPAFAKVRALVRRPLDFQHPRLEVEVLDLDDTHAIYSQLGTGDCIFSCIGTTQKAVNGNNNLYRKIDHDIPVNVAKLGRTAGFRTFLLVSSVGANERATNFYLKLKGEVERDIEAIGFTNTCIFRPAMILGERKEKRLGEGLLQSVMNTLSKIFIGPLQKFKAIEAADIAKAMIAAARNANAGTRVYQYDEMMHLCNQKLLK